MEQHMAALAKANNIRIRRAKIKKQIASGEVTREEVIDIIARPPNFLRTMPIKYLIESMPGFGPTKSQKILKRARLTQQASLDVASAGQRASICEQLAVWPEK